MTRPRPTSGERLDAVADWLCQYFWLITLVSLTLALAADITTGGS